MNMNNQKADVIIGLQWGDEGKGRVTEYLALRYDVIARFNGGPNSVRTIPHGAVLSDTLLILGNGMAISPDCLMNEIKQIEHAGVYLKDRLLISKRAQLIMPSHRLLDKAYESVRAENKLSTSSQGVGPAYADKANRVGLRIGDIVDHFAEKFATHKAVHESILRSMHFYSPMEINNIESEWLEGVEYIKQFKFVDTEREIHKLMQEGKMVLCEGARGAMLDVDMGTYPFVTSCNTVSAAACTGLGIPPTMIGTVYGVAKIYSTRVGAGPFPTELFDANAKKMREKGNELGTGTEYERRCGWIDLVALKHAIMINGVNKLILTKCDAFDEFETIKACVAYKKDVEFIDYYPDEKSHEELEPIYVEMQGWKERLSYCRKESDFPAAFIEFVRFLEKELGVPVSYVSVGFDKEQTIEMDVEKRS